MIMRKTARLAEQTVKDAERHAGSYAPKRRSGGSRRSSRVTEAQVREDIMEAARRLVTPGVTRVRILSVDEVIVENIPMERQA